MSNIFNTNKPVAHNGRNGFDLSTNRVFDMRPSVLRPVFVQHTVPNSSYKINCADLVRTGALQQAAFLRARQELDFFFVPYSLIFSKSNDILFQRSEEHSLIQTVVPNSHFPTISLGNLIVWAAFPMWFEFYLNKYILYCRDYKWTKYVLFDEVLNWFLQRVPNVDPSASITPEQRDRLARCVSYTPRSTRYLYLSNISFIGADSVKLLSTTLYGDYLLALQADMELYYQTFKTQIHTDWDDDIFTSFWSYFGEHLAQFIRANIDSDYSIQQFQGSRHVNIIDLCGYQKIFRDVYRDSINDTDDDFCYLYSSNLDYQDGSLDSIVNSPVGVFQSTAVFPASYAACPMLTYLHPRLRMFKKDLSCGLWPSSQYGGVGAADITDSFKLFADQFDSSSIQQLRANTSTGAVFNSKSGSGYNYDYHASGMSVSALQMRYATAMQKYRETLLRAGNRTKDLLMAEFGVKSHYVNDTYVRHLGSFGGALELNKVSATADGGDYTVGDLAANVFSSLSGDTIEFTCNDHGMIIGVMSFVAHPLHNAFGVSPFHTKFNSMDFYHEAFENLGLQPVSSSVFNVMDIHSDGETTLGFSARYNEYKQNLDFVHDTFTTSPDLDDHRSEYVNDGINSNYVCVRPITQTISGIKDRSYMLPSIMDSIFKQADSGFGDGSQFHITLSIGCSAVLPMSTLGLPY